MASTSPSNGVVYDDAQKRAGDPDEVDIATSLQALNTKENNEVDGRTCSGVTSRKAKEIRKQVDYYFSAENLQRDNFLHKKMNGSKNRPIPLQVIADFAKMKSYRPLSAIVEALQTSKTVNVVEKDGQTCLQRKESFSRIPLASASGIVKAKPSAATGFEDWFADAPLTPDAAKEELELYDIDLPVTERIETAVQRYQVRRKMHSFAKNVFIKWLMYGGIDISPNPFAGGPSPEELANMTTKEKKAAAANVNCFAATCDEDGTPQWEVDFVGVTKSFLSRVLPQVIDLHSEDRVREATNVMENFYRYLNYHNVCPEHTADINSARRVCVTAAHELVDTYHLERFLPGPFNTACSTLFGGAQQGLYAADEAWNSSAAGFDKEGIEVGQSNTRAKQLFMTATVALDLDKDVEASSSNDHGDRITNQKVVEVGSEIGLEVVEIVFPSAEATEFYEELGAGYSPLGKLVCKPWTAPDYGDWDLPAGMGADEPTPETYTILLERDLLDHCFKGMKLEGMVNTLASGLQWLDAIRGVRCSFYTVLENELVKGWKEPRFWTREEWLMRSAGLAAKDHTDDDEEAADVD